MMTNQDDEVNIFQNAPLLANTVLFYLNVPSVSNHVHSLGMFVRFTMVFMPMFMSGTH